jgi:hypothetical protein
MMDENNYKDFNTNNRYVALDDLEIADSWKKFREELGDKVTMLNISCRNKPDQQ